MDAGVWIDAVVGLSLAALVTSLLLGSSRGGTKGGARPWLGRLRSIYPTVVRQAGFDPSAVRWIYWGAKLALAGLLPLLLAEVGASRATPLPSPWLLAGAGAGFLIPDLWLLGRRRRRRRRIQTTLSFFIDLLVSLLHSGLGLEEAFRRAGRGVRFADASQPLADEVELAVLELEAGRDRAAAFEALTDRTGVKELRGVAAALRLGLRVGASMESTLAAQAEILRNKRGQDALKRIGRATVQALVPTFLCGFPVLALLIFFPAVLELMDALAILRDLFA